MIDLDQLEAVASLAAETPCKLATVVTPKAILALIAVARAAMAVEQTSGNSIDDLSNLSAALTALAGKDGNG